MARTTRNYKERIYFIQDRHWQHLANLLFEAKKRTERGDAFARAFDVKIDRGGSCKLSGKKGAYLSVISKTSQNHCDRAVQGLRILRDLIVKGEEDDITRAKIYELADSDLANYLGPPERETNIELDTGPTGIEEISALDVPDDDLNDHFDYAARLSKYDGHIKPRNDEQRRALDLMERNDLIFITGETGTGKTLMAELYAFTSYTHARYQKHLPPRVVLARPAVEAGESLGFMPGKLSEKIGHYLMPLYENAWTILGDGKREDGKIKLNKMIESDTTEIIALAFTRGRTFHNTILILDEAQNATLEQIELFTTRAGENSTVIIAGDPRQNDLGDTSGLQNAIDIWSTMEGAAQINLEEVERSALSARLVAQRQRYEASQQSKKVTSLEDHRDRPPAPPRPHSTHGLSPS